MTRPALPIVVVSALLCLGAANIASRVQFHEVEDGVLWTANAEGVAAREIAGGTAAAASGLKPGDILLAIDDEPIQRVDDVEEALHRADDGATLRYTVLRLGTREVLDIRVAPVPNGPTGLYFVLAAVGIFTLLVGGAVRLRRPRDPATLHFFWLAVAFFGVFTFSFSGRLDRLDWVFFWADEISILVLPPMFLHFTLVFPDRPRRWTGGSAGRLLAAALYVPAVALGIARIVAVSRGDAIGTDFVRVTDALDRFEFFYLAICLIGGLIGLTRAVARVRTITGRRQLRWIVWGTAFGAGPFALGYALPYAIGVTPSLPMELSAIPLSLIPLAYASAIVRYRLMDIEVIVKRTLVYAAALSAIVAMYAILLQLVDRTFVRGANNPWVLALLATLVAVLLAPPVKDFVQNMLDRAFYRDRYDYRRALVGFARDLNSDLDLHRLAERLVTRVVETLLVDRMALMVEDEVAPHFGSIRSSGFGDVHPPALPQRSGIGARLLTGHVVARLLRNLLATGVVIGVALLVGFRPTADVGGWVGAITLIALYILTITYLFAAIGLAAGSPEAASGYGFIILFLPYLSSAFVPVDTMPTWLQWIAENQPITPIIETIRSLLFGLPLGTQPWWALGWCFGILLFAVIWGAWLFRRKAGR